MEIHESSPETERSGEQARTNECELPRFSVVSPWYDGQEMEFADLADEIAGQKMTAISNKMGSTIQFSRLARRGNGFWPGVPGFLFTGDDGDSLWFWPESDGLAFRFEPKTGDRVRMSLDENVSRLVSQGALVFCYHFDSGEQFGSVLEFPEPEQMAA